MVIGRVLIAALLGASSLATAQTKANVWRLPKSGLASASGDWAKAGEVEKLVQSINWNLSKRHPVMVVFMSTWSPNSRQRLPFISALSLEYSGEMAVLVLWTKGSLDPVAHDVLERRDRFYKEANGSNVMIDDWVVEDLSSVWRELASDLSQPRVIEDQILLLGLDGKVRWQNPPQQVELKLRDYVDAMIAVDKALVPFHKLVFEPEIAWCQRTGGRPWYEPREKRLPSKGFKCLPKKEIKVSKK